MAVLVMVTQAMMVVVMVAWTLLGLVISSATRVTSVDQAPTPPARTSPSTRYSLPALDLALEGTEEEQEQEKLDLTEEGQEARTANLVLSQEAA